MASFQPDELPSIPSGFWRLPMQGVSVDHGNFPELVVPGGFSVVSGVCPRVRGNVRRSYGYTLWCELMSAVDLRPQYQTSTLCIHNPADGPYCGPGSEEVDLPEFRRGFWDMRPFTIAKRASRGYIWGVVLYAPAVGPSQSNVWIIYKDSEESGTNDPYFDDAGEDSGLPNHAGFKVAKLRVNRSTDAPGVFAQIPVVVNTEMFLYTFGVAAENTEKKDSGSLVRHYTTWHESREGELDNAGLRHDYFGVPPANALHIAALDRLNESDSGFVGHSIRGKYELGFRLVDPFRNRRSKACYWRPLGNLTTLANRTKAWFQSRSDGVSNLDYVIYEPKAIVGLLSSGFVTTPSIVTDQAQWTHWEALATLSSALAGIQTNYIDGSDVNRVVDSKDLSPGGFFYVADRMPTLVSFRTEDDDSLTFYPVTLARLFIGGPVSGGDDDAGNPGLRSESWVADPDDSGHPNGSQRIPCTDSSNAVSEQIDFDLDDYRDWDEIGEVYAAAIYQGLLVLIANPATKSEAVNAPITLDQQVKIIWSDPRRPAYENFSYSSFYPTRYRLPKPKPNDRIEVFEDEVTDRSFMDTAPFMLVECSNYLYAFGDGPVYRGSRDGLFFDLRTVEISVPIVSRDAVASYGTGMVAVANDGVYNIDGASGSKTKIEAIERLIRDRWRDPAISSRISVAYDSVLDSVYILSPGTAEMVVLCLEQNTVTLETCHNFAFVRSGLLPTSASAFAPRALFMTWYGKIVYPDHMQSDEVGGATLHGLVRSPGTLGDSNIVMPDSWTMLVSDQDASDTQDDINLLTLTLTNLDGTPASWTNYLTSGVTISFLTGPWKNQVHQTFYQPVSGDTPGDAVDILRILRPADIPDLVGSVVSISPVPFVMVGAPLTGQREAMFMERKFCDAVIPVIRRVMNDTSFLSSGLDVPAMQVGLVGVSALLGTEPQEPPSGIPFRPDAGALPLWVDLGDDTVRLKDLRITGTLGDNSRGYALATPLGDDNTGVSDIVPIPVLISLVSDWSFDLIDVYYRGAPERSEDAAGE